MAYNCVLLHHVAGCGIHLYHILIEKGKEAIKDQLCKYYKQGFMYEGNTIVTCIYNFWSTIGIKRRLF